MVGTPASRQRLQHALGRRRHASAGDAEDDAGVQADLDYLPGAGLPGIDVGRAEQNAVRAECACEQVSAADAVLKREYGGARPHGGAYDVYSGVVVVALDAEDDQVGRLRAVRRGGGVRPHRELAGRPALHVEAALADRLQVFAARDERNVLARLREQAAVVAADASGTHHQRSSLARLR